MRLAVPRAGRASSGATGRGIPRPVRVAKTAQVSEYRDLWHPSKLCGETRTRFSLRRAAIAGQYLRPTAAGDHMFNRTHVAASLMLLLAAVAVRAEDAPATQPTT